MSRYEERFFQYFNNVLRYQQARPLVLGGATATSGGAGGPPGGFVGSLPQSRVTFDLSEDAIYDVPNSGISLVTNLNRIRYRIAVLENAPSGIGTIEKDDLVIASAVSILNFEGYNTIIDEGNGKVTIVTSGGGIQDWATEEESWAGTVTDKAVSPSTLPVIYEDDAFIRHKGYRGNTRGTSAIDLQATGDADDVAAGDASIVAGGEYNAANGWTSAAIGGYNNTVTGDAAAILGGENNTMADSSIYDSAIIGGAYNEIHHVHGGAILGGDTNILQNGSHYSSILGGNDVIISGQLSVGFGRKVDIMHHGAAAFTDYNPNTYESFHFATTKDMELALRYRGGIRLVTAVDGSGNTTRGATLDSDGKLSLTTASGVPPLSVTSNTLVSGLNVEFLDGYRVTDIVAGSGVVPVHNDLDGLQGGAAGEYYHLTSGQIADLHSAVTVVDSSRIDLSLTGQQITADIVASSITNTYLADDSVNEPKLDVTNNPISGYYLSYDGTDMFWSSVVSSGVGASSLDELTDVSTPSPTKNYALKWNGAEWVAAPYDYDFTFSIASFDDGQTATQLIGAGVWKSTGNISFTASYTNGPATAAYIVLSSDGGVSWASNLTLSTPYTSGSSAEDTDYPSSKDTYVRFTLNATDGSTPNTATATVYFRNYIYWGVATKNSSFSESDVESLANSEISNDQTRSMSINSSTNQYLVFAFPSSYTSIPAGSDYETNGDTGFIFNSLSCAFNAYETVSITNSAGYTENYKVYASTQANLGNHTLVTTTSAATIDRLYYGVTTKTSSFLESDVEGLANSSVTNDNTQTWSSVTAGSGEYLLFAFPKRLGTVTFWVGGFEGGFESPETVSVTNVNGWSEDYYVWRSTNSNLGATVVVTQ